MDFKKYLNQTARQIDTQVEKILSEWLKEVEKTDKSLVPLAKAFISSCMGGKRIRGALCKLGYEMARNHLRGETKFSFRLHLGGGSQEIIKIGAAYEIFHAAILAHDDIMDKSPTRRGNKSLYKRVGVSQAITLGDLGFFLATKIISESSFPDSDKTRALRLFSKTMVDTALGQMLDIQKGNLKTIMLLKTAYYTISAPLQLGAILGGLGPTSPRLRGVKVFGEKLGIAFQIQDDILDGDALDSSSKMGVKYVARAKRLIPNITSDKRFVKLLEEMANYLIERSK